MDQSFMQKINPLVSVKVISYNQENYIKDCLEGVLMQQTNFPFEIVISDDCSSDKTGLIIAEYEKKYPGLIRNISSDQNIGAIANGQKVRAACKGKYQAGCEGDDYWTDPNKLQKQVDYLEQNPDCAGCFHETQLIFEEDGKIGRILGIETPDKLWPVDLFSCIAPFHTSSFIFRTNALDCPAWFNMISSGDIAIFSIISKSGYFKKIDGIMSVYRKNKSGLTTTKFHNEFYHQKRIELAVLLNHYHDYKYSDKAMEVIGFHLSELMKSKEKPGLNVKKWGVFKALKKIQKRIFP